MEFMKIINVLEMACERLEINNIHDEESEYILECQNTIAELKAQMPDNSMYFIRNIEDDSEYWCNHIGWVSDINSASVFNKSELVSLQLPNGGKWVAAK